MPLFTPEPGFTESQRKKLIDIGGEAFAADLESLSDERLARSFEYLNRSPDIHDSRKPSRIRRSGGVPSRGDRGSARQWIGLQVKYMMEKHDIEVDSSRAGDFVEVLGIILNVTGAKESAVAIHPHRLAQDILK